MIRGKKFFPALTAGTRRILLVLLFSALSVGMATQAWAIVAYNRGGKELKLGLRALIWYQAIQAAAPNGSTSNGFALRQARIYMAGRYSKTISFGTHFDWNKVGSVDGKTSSSASTSLTDAFLGFNFMPQLKFMTGQYRIAFSRYSLTATTSAHLFPHNPFAASPALLTSTGNFRQTGVTAWGFLGKRLRYNLGIASGLPQTFKTGSDSSDSLLYSARAEYTLLGLAKEGYLHKNEWNGKRGKFATVGAGFLTKKYSTTAAAPFHNATYSAWTMDEYSEYPIAGGSIATEAAYYYYNFDNRLDPNVQSWFAQAGYLLPGKIGPGRLEPGVRYDTYRLEGVAGATTKVWTAGLNYYIYGNNVKWSLEWLNISNGAGASQNLAVFSGIKGKDTNAVTVQLQFMI